MAYAYSIDKLYGSVSQSLAIALLIYCPPAYIYNKRVSLSQRIHTIERSQMTSEYMLCILQHALPKYPVFLNLFIFQGFILHCLKKEGTSRKKIQSIQILPFSKELQTSSHVFYLTVYCNHF